MKNLRLMISTLEVSCFAGLFLFAAPTLAGSAHPISQDPARKAADQTAGQTAKPAEVKGAKASAPSDPVAVRRKKAQNILNQCYEEALESDPNVKLPLLLNIAQRMVQIDRERGLFIYEQAFNAIPENGSSGIGETRAVAQSNIARMVTGIDPETALKLALRIEPKPGSMVDECQRPNTIGSILVFLTDKDPERAYGIVRKEMERDQCLDTLVVPMAVALQRKRPDLAEILYIEAIRQFDKTASDGQAFIDFIDMVSNLFDLNRALTGQAVDLILSSIDYLGEHPPGLDFKMETFDGKTKTSYGGLRDFAIAKVIPLVQRLNPERAKMLEEKYSASRAFQAPMTGREVGGFSQYSMTPPAQPPAQNQTTNKTQVPSSSQPPPREFTYSTTTLINRNAPAHSTQPPSEFNARMAATRARAEKGYEAAQIAGLARSDPNAALDRMESLAPGPYRIRAMAGIATAIFKTDPEKAKSLLSDAASATDKLSDPYDRAECDNILARGFLLFDEERAQKLLTEAFKLVDQLAEEENERKLNPQIGKVAPERFRSSESLFRTLLSTLAMMNFDDAIARANGIQDKQRRLTALVNIAGDALRQK